MASQAWPQPFVLSAITNYKGAGSICECKRGRGDGIDMNQKILYHVKLAGRDPAKTPVSISLFVRACSYLIRAKTGNTPATTGANHQH